MPILTDLDERLQRAPFDLDEFQKRLLAAQAIAERIHLVHVTGVPTEAEKWNVFISIVTDPPYEIPTSDHGVYCTDETRRAEERLGLPPSVYFYAGRAHSDFGSIAIVFDADSQRGRSGSATPFDTGGFMWQPTPHIKVRLERNDERERVRYCQESELPLEQWRDAFARVLAAYFDRLEDYWTNGPARSDPEGLYELNDDWRCWTFEIRLAEPQPIHDRTAWCADESVMHKLFRLHPTEPATPGAPRPINRFLNDVPAMEPAGSPFFCNVVESWVREQLGI